MSLHFRPLSSPARFRCNQAFRALHKFDPYRLIEYRHGSLFVELLPSKNQCDEGLALSLLYGLRVGYDYCSRTEFDLK